MQQCASVKVDSGSVRRAGIRHTKADWPTAVGSAASACRKRILHGSKVVARIRTVSFGIENIIIRSSLGRQVWTILCLALSFTCVTCVV